MSDALKRLITEVEAGGVRPYVIEEMAAPMFHHSVWPNIAKSYGGDLNAAKALHDALLPGWVWWFEPFREIAFCGVYNPEISPLPFTSGDVCPARAWLLAILRAYQQVQQ